MSVRELLHRPAGIRNGGLLLILTALAVAMTLVDGPSDPGRARRPPGVFQFLPPPIGIALPPPAVAAPPVPVAAGGGELERTPRRHPVREQPRPSRSRDRDGRVAGSASRPAPAVAGTGRPVGGGGGGGGPGGGAPSRPAPVAEVEVGGPVRVRVPAAGVRVTPPRAAGDLLRPVAARTPEVDADLAVPTLPVP